MQEVVVETQTGNIEKMKTMREILKVEEVEEAEVLVPEDAEVT